MKKNYQTPNTNIVEVKLDNLMQSNSVEALRGEASSSSEGMGRSFNWDDED